MPSLFFFVALSCAAACIACNFKQGGRFQSCTSDADCASFHKSWPITCKTAPNGYEALGNTVTNVVTGYTYVNGNCTSQICINGTITGMITVTNINTYCTTCKPSN